MNKANQNQKIRVVLINDFNWANGGATKLVNELATHLAHEGLLVTLFNGSKIDTRSNLPSEIDVISLEQDSISEGGAALAFRAVYNIKARKTLARWITANDTYQTIYHVHGWSKILSPSIFSALKPVWGRTFVHTHDYFMACPNGGFYNYQKNEVCPHKPLSHRCLTTNCDKRSYLHKILRIARQISLAIITKKLCFDGKLLVIHQGMNVFFSRSHNDRAIVEVRNPSGQYRDPQPIKASAKYGLFIGRLEPEKGIEELITAYCGTDFKLKVVGTGSEKKRLKNRAKGNIEFLGWLEHSEIGDLLNEVRFLVVPSKYPEPFGLVITESIKSGIPVLINDNAALAPEISRNKLGLTFDTSLEGDFTAKVRFMHKEDLTEMSENCLKQGATIYRDLADWNYQLHDLYRLATEVE